MLACSATSYKNVVTSKCVHLGLGTPQLSELGTFSCILRPLAITLVDVDQH